MRFRGLALVLLTLGCATNPVMLERYRGVYSTHFDGIPDQAGVCAVISNRGTSGVDWVRLRMRVYTNFGDVPGRWTSSWLYRGRLEPGQSIAVELRNPPTAEGLEIEVIRSGHGSGPSRGRSVRSTPECSEAWLRAELSRRLASRTAAGVRVLPMDRHEESAELLLAQP